MIAAGQLLETLAAAWSEATPAERKEVLGLVLETVVVDVAKACPICARPNTPHAALFRQLPGLRECDGYLYVAPCENAELGF
jgi:hypothetical protein